MAMRAPSDGLGLWKMKSNNGINASTTYQTVGTQTQVLHHKIPQLFECLLSAIPI